MAPPRVAIIHYWLVAMRGGERVLERVLRMFPQADLFTHVFDPGAVSDEIRLRKVETTFIDKLPFSRRLYQKYLPLMPMALEELDLRGYDLVLSFEAGPAKGVIAAPEALHVCYCHSPMRYLWDAYPEYRASAGRLARAVMPWTFPQLRVWDHASAARVDGFIANSRFIQQRIRRAYGRQSVVVHPPVPVHAFQASTEVSDEYLWVGQMTPYKRADVAVEAFNRLGKPLALVGRGEMRPSLQAMAGPTVRFRDGLRFSDLAAAYARAKALVYTAEEDFGIIPVEAQAAGRPVLAFGKGGVLDSLQPGVGGLTFDAQTPASLAVGVEALERWLPAFDPLRAQAAVARFRPERFDAEYLAAVAGYAADRPQLQSLLRSMPAFDPTAAGGTRASDPEPPPVPPRVDEPAGSRPAETKAPVDALAAAESNHL